MRLGLACARAGEDKQGPFCGDYGFMLLFV